MAFKTTSVQVIYHNGVIYTADAKDSVVQAIAITDGYIVSLGSDADVLCLQQKGTVIVDLQGKMVMPGIIDSHLHTFWGGKQLQSCNLDYASLTVEQILERIQASLDTDPLAKDSDWFQVRSWLRQEMLPSGADITCFDLDRLKTQRPIIIFSNDCHTLVASSRALTLLGIDKNTPEPEDGKIGRNLEGELTGILEDAPAMRAYDSIQPSDKKLSITIAEIVQEKMNSQGVTTVMDARVFSEQLDAFLALRAEKKLTLRVLGAREVTPEKLSTFEDAQKAMGRVKKFADTYNLRTWEPEPDVAVSHVKFFIDGILQAPLMTASLLSPYLENRGSETEADWQPTDRYGDLYFSQNQLDNLMLAAAEQGLHPHMHTVGEGAVEITLNAIEKMRLTYPNKDIRPGLAHNEIVAKQHYARFRELNATAVLSFQWAGIAQELMDKERNMLGDERFQEAEPAGKFIDVGARIAFGSDWPIDELNEWYDFKVALTRRGKNGSGDIAPRLDTDRNMTLIEVLRSATIDAAYMLGQESKIGSLEQGKFADFIVLDRNIMALPQEQIEQVELTRVLKTVLGGKEVFNL